MSPTTLIRPSTLPPFDSRYSNQRPCPLISSPFVFYLFHTPGSARPLPAVPCPFPYLLSHYSHASPSKWTHYLPLPPSFLRPGYPAPFLPLSSTLHQRCTAHHDSKSLLILSPTPPLDASHTPASISKGYRNNILLIQLGARVWMHHAHAPCTKPPTSKQVHLDTPACQHYVCQHPSAEHMPRGTTRVSFMHHHSAGRVGKVWRRQPASACEVVARRSLFTRPPTHRSPSSPTRPSFLAPPPSDRSSQGPREHHAPLPLHTQAQRPYVPNELHTVFVCTERRWDGYRTGAHQDRCLNNETGTPCP